MSNYWFTADEHYSHSKIIQYCNRPFANAKEMDEALISNHNEVVKANDTVIHAGDLTLDGSGTQLSKLNGYHVFLRGSHDKWMECRWVR